VDATTAPVQHCDAAAPLPRQLASLVNSRGAPNSIASHRHGRAERHRQQNQRPPRDRMKAGLPPGAPRSGRPGRKVPFLIILRSMVRCRWHRWTPRFHRCGWCLFRNRRLAPPEKESRFGEQFAQPWQGVCREGGIAHGLYTIACAVKHSQLLHRPQRSNRHRIHREITPP
jgi:hypothetical protein